MVTIRKSVRYFNDGSAFEGQRCENTFDYEDLGGGGRVCNVQYGSDEYS
jgi:hypothetical protein